VRRLPRDRRGGGRSPEDRQAGSLAAHVAAAICARTDRSAWLCAPDEPEWLLRAEVTDNTIFGVARPSALEAAGTLGSLPEIFIGCEWASSYLTGGRPADQIGE
jgi:hypothetical protein